MARKTEKMILRFSFFLLIVLATAGSARADDIDLSGYTETFSETFRDRLDVTAWGPSRWIAHTPWHGDVGAARFVDPLPQFPFQTGPDGLTIIAAKDPNGKWVSGLLSSNDPKGRGFSQAGGYFEARMKLPKGKGVWPAFWLVGRNDPLYDVEFDVLEYYGVDPGRYQICLHYWPKDKKNTPKKKDFLVHAAVPQNISLTDDFHTYGVDISEEAVIYYFDRKEMVRTQSSPIAMGPLMILVNFGLGGGWPVDETPNPSYLQVDYIKAYQKKDAR